MVEAGKEEISLINGRAQVKSSQVLLDLTPPLPSLVEAPVSFTDSTSESQGESSSSSSSAPTAGRAPTNKVRSETPSAFISLYFSPLVKPYIQKMCSGSIAEDKLRSKCYSRVSPHPATQCYFLYTATSSCLFSSGRQLCTTADTATSNTQHMFV